MTGGPPTPSPARAMTGHGDDPLLAPGMIGP